MELGIVPKVSAPFFLAALVATANAFAAQNDTDPSQPKLVEEMVVVGERQVGYHDGSATSALKSNVPLLETPASVFTANSELIADQQSFRLDQILQNDSSVQKANNFLGAYSSYKIRGFDLLNGSNFMRDGRAFFQLASSPTEVLDRVEVLKGPASVLYGTLTPGGLINMVSKRPPREFEGFVKATIGTDALQHIHADIGGAIADERLRYRVNVIREESEYFREFFNGDSFDVERDIYSFAVEFDLTDRTTVLVNFDDTTDDRPQDNGLIGDTEDVLDILDYDLIYNQPWSHYDSEVTNYFVELDHSFNDAWSIQLGYSFQDYQRDRYDNQLRGFDAETGDNVIRARRRLNRRDYETMFFDVTGKLETGPLIHNILVGYDETDIERRDKEIENADRVTFVSNIFGPAFPDPQIPIGNRRVEGDETRTGFYVQDMIEVGEDWRVLVGGRWDDYETTIGGDYDDDNFTPRVGVLYLIQPNLSVYSTYAESFEPNGPVGGGFANEGEQLDPTVGEMVEIGVKWEGNDGKLLVSGAVFSVERDGEPIENIFTNRIEQRGLAEHNGAEVSVSGLIGEELSLIGSATYLDAEIKENDNAALVGNTPYGVADLSLSFWAEYQFDSFVPGLSLQGGVFYESDRPVDDANTFDLDSYVRVDIGAKYVWSLANEQDITTRLTVSNLFDEEYYKARTPFAINPERPREVRFSVEYAF